MFEELKRKLYPQKDDHFYIRDKFNDLEEFGILYDEYKGIKYFICKIWHPNMFTNKMEFQTKYAMLDTERNMALRYNEVSQQLGSKESLNGYLNIGMIISILTFIKFPIMLLVLFGCWFYSDKVVDIQVSNLSEECVTLTNVGDVYQSIKDHLDTLNEFELKSYMRKYVTEEVKEGLEKYCIWREAYPYANPNSYVKVLGQKLVEYNNF